MRFLFFAVIIISANQATANTSSTSPCRVSEQPAYSTTVRPVRELGIVGSLHTPVGCDPSSQSIVVVLGGSEGGIPSDVAEQLAKRGMTTLALGYFNTDGLPSDIDLISLDYFENALQKVTELVPQSKCCVVMGFSKGAEGALAFASILKPQLLGLILISGTNSAFEGFQAVGSGKNTGNSSWTARGQPIGFTPYASPDEALLGEMFPQGMAFPPVLKPFYGASLALSTGTRGALPIEDVRSPVLFLSGKDDQMWNSYKMAESAVQRAKDKGFNFDITHISFSEVGHLVLASEYLEKDPYNLIRFGGTVAGSRAAEPIVWGKIVEFVKRSFH